MLPCVVQIAVGNRAVPLQADPLGNADQRIYSAGRYIYQRHFQNIDRPKLQLLPAVFTDIPDCDRLYDYQAQPF